LIVEVEDQGESLQVFPLDFPGVPTAFRSIAFLASPQVDVDQIAIDGNDFTLLKPHNSFRRFDLHGDLRGSPLHVVLPTLS
jgi:hypothetical protein